MVEQVQRIAFATKDMGEVRALPALDGGGGLRYPLNSPAAASRDWLTVIISITGSLWMIGIVIRKKSQKSRPQRYKK